VDDLSAPLGQNKPRQRRYAVPLAVPWAVVGLLSASIATFAGWAMFANDPLGGEPVAVARADLAAATAASREEAPQALRPANERPSRHDGATSEAAQPSGPPAKTVTIIDGTSGKRQEVVLPAGEPETKAEPAEAALTEKGRHGPLPRIAADGSRPSEAYARPVKPIPGKPDAPRVAIVIGGLGVSAAASADALNKLPPAVTFALMPYASDVAQLAARARSDGHELLLLAPMEPFDYPDNDPGPQTLLTTLDSAHNIDRLHWLMSRFQGYVGVANLMGGRFTSSEQALTPVFKELGKRGLIYLDDGSSPRSQAMQAAFAANLPFAKADVVLDSVPNAADIDRALGRLERVARERGSAVGIAGPMPVAIERIGKWAKSAQSRGLLLVPISAVASRGKSS
jgi:hypothetical protein